MVVVGMFTVWFGYTVGLYGYCLARGYSVGFKELIVPSEWPGWDTITAAAPATPSTATRPGKEPGGGSGRTTPKGTPVPIQAAPGGTSRFGV